MAGSYQKRGDHSYLLTYHIGYDTNGKRIRKTRTVKAKNDSEAEIKLAEFITEIEAGEYIAPSKTKFGDYVKIWRKDIAKQIAPKTLETYDYTIYKWLLPVFSHMKIQDIDHIQINTYLEKLEGRNLSSSTLIRHYNILNSIFKLAVRNETIKKNPVEKVPRPSVTHKEGDVYTSEELQELYRLLNKEENQQQALIVKLALMTGMRKGEILALQWKDLDFEKTIIHVRHSLSHTKEEGYILKEPKTKRSIRKVAPPEKLMQDLKNHQSQKVEDRANAQELWEGGTYFFVFSSDLGKPLYPNAPDRWLRRFFQRTGFKKVRFHDLRHTSATTLINKANMHTISKRLGHTNITTTMNQYGHYLEEADKEIAQLFNEDYI